MEEGDDNSDISSNNSNIFSFNGLEHESKLDDDDDSIIGQKRPVGDLYYNSSVINSQPERKKRKITEQRLKRQKYDILQAFLRVYFIQDNDSAVLKEAIYNLYTRKISNTLTIARNAMYRHMWSYFGKDICSSQSNYREYIKGLKLMTNENHLTYEGHEKDVELLQQNGVSELFDFCESDLITNTKSKESLTKKINNTENKDDIIQYVEQLEQQAIILANSLKQLKEKLSQ